MGLTPQVSNFVAFADLQPVSEASTSACIYYLVEKGRRCLVSPSKSDIKEAASVQRRILENSHSPSQQDLRSFALLNCCKRHHRSKLEDYGLLALLTERWTRELRDCSEQEDPSLTTTQLTLPKLNSRIKNAVSPTSSPLHVQHRYNLRSTTSDQRRFIAIDSPSLPSQDTGFRAHTVPPSQTVATTLLKHLTPRDSQSGSLYLFARSSSPGHVKIGITRQAVQARLNQWGRKCGYIPRLVASFADVPHVYRVETLVHFELAKHWRTEIRCSGCSIQHQEWFEVQESLAIEVARKYVKWIREAEPYDEEGSLKTIWQEEVRCQVAEHGCASIDELLRKVRQIQMVAEQDTRREDNVSQESSVMRTATILEQKNQVRDIADAILALSAEQQCQLVQALRTGPLSAASALQTPLPSIPSAYLGGSLIRRETTLSLMAQA